MKKLLLCVVLAGCANHWTRDDATDEQVKQDLAQCRSQAESAAAPIYDAIWRGVRTNELMESCLAARGYRKAS